MGKVNIREKGLRRDDCHYELFSNKCTDQERAPSISVPGRRYQVSKNSSGCIKLAHKRVAILAFGHTGIPNNWTWNYPHPPAAIDLRLTPKGFGTLLIK